MALTNRSRAVGVAMGRVESRAMGVAMGIAMVTMMGVATAGRGLTFWHRDMPSTGRSFLH